MEVDLVHSALHCQGPEKACVKCVIYIQNLAVVNEFPTNNESLWTFFDINMGNI